MIDVCHENFQRAIHAADSRVSHDIGNRTRLIITVLQALTILLQLVFSSANTFPFRQKPFTGNQYFFRLTAALTEEPHTGI